MFRPAYGILTVLVFCLAGCGWGGIPPNPDHSLPILPSDEIATGAWDIIGYDANGVVTSPIGGFLGAITASGTYVEAGFLMGTSSAPGSYQPSNCAPNIAYTLVTMTGTAKDGTLALQSSFAGNFFQLNAQLSNDRRSFTSGSWSVRGPCATTTTTIVGYYTAPLTGTYTGPSLSAAGVNKQIIAKLSQENEYFPGGIIPVDGTVTLSDSSCTVSAKLYGGYVVGDQSILGGYTAGTNPAITGNNFLLLGEEDDRNANILTSDDWSYQNSNCGTDYQNLSSVSQLPRQ